MPALIVEAEFRRYGPTLRRCRNLSIPMSRATPSKFCGVEYVIYSPDLSHDGSWERATHAFFKIVDDQLSGSDYRLCAINGGNDLGGMFLTTSECEAAPRSLARSEDWPYLPTLEDPWYGQFHR